MTTTIYHNPRCSKSRHTLELLQQQGYAPVTVEYLKSPPTAAELREILRLLQIPARDLLRTKEEEYATLQLDNPALSEEQLIAAMASHPRLIERPIVIHNGKAAIGRPPERVLEILK